MARKITTDAINAFMSAKTFNRDNTSVEVRPFKDEKVESVILKLHGNVIARRLVGSNTIEVCDGNYQSKTTKERLNGIPGVSVCQRKGVWYLNSVEWDGSWTSV